MANQPRFGWGPQPPPFPSAGHPIAGLGQGLRQSSSPGAPMPQPQPCLNVPSYPYSPGTPPSPFMSPGLGQGVYWNMQPIPPGPGYNHPGYSPYPPRNFAGMASSPRATMIQAPPNNFAQRPDRVPQGMVRASQASAPQRQGHEQAQGVRSLSVLCLGDSGLVSRQSQELTLAPPNLLFCHWIEDLDTPTQSGHTGTSSSSSSSSSRVDSHKPVSTKASDLYQLVDQVEETIRKIAGVINLQDAVAETEFCPCPFDPHHCVPPEALFRHSLRCPSSSGSPVEVDSFLNCLCYPHKFNVASCDHLSVSDAEAIVRHSGPEFVRDNVTLSFEYVALQSVNASTVRLPSSININQEPQATEQFQLSKPSAVDSNRALVVRTSLGSSVGRRDFDPLGSFFFYGEAPGVILMSSYLSTNIAKDFTLSLPLCLQAELALDSVTTRKSIGRAHIETFASASAKAEAGNDGEGDGVIEGEEECHKSGNEIIFKGRDLHKRIERGKTMEVDLQSKQRRQLKNIEFEDDIQPVRLLPSMVWLLDKEIEGWVDMPTRWSGLALGAASGLGRVQKSQIVKWLLVHSPSYGVLLDVAMASHIYYLVQLFLKAVRTQWSFLKNEIQTSSLSRLKQEPDLLSCRASCRTMASSMLQHLVECPVLAEGSSWLALCLTQLYEPAKSKALVLNLLKHCLKLCARSLSIVSLDSHLELPNIQSLGKTSIDNDKDCLDARCGASLADDGQQLETEKDGSISVTPIEFLNQELGLRHIGTAMDALQERATFGRYLSSWISVNQISKPRLIAEYDVAVKHAEAERARRPAYRAVCEHDGLTWQRSHQKERKNKTRAELLAEERDYKRRRMSYRGKKLKRSPIQVLHDIIEGHMAEIADAGGIGCFAKQPPLASPFEPETKIMDEHNWNNPSRTDVRHHSSSASHPPKTNMDRTSYARLTYEPVEGYERSKG